jgi:hypothetical protein
MVMMATKQRGNDDDGVDDYANKDDRVITLGLTLHDVTISHLRV